MSDEIYNPSPVSHLSDTAHRTLVNSLIYTLSTDTCRIKLICLLPKWLRKRELLWKFSTTYLPPSISDFWNKERLIIRDPLHTRATLIQAQIWVEVCHVLKISGSQKSVHFRKGERVIVGRNSLLWLIRVSICLLRQYE